MTTYDTVVIGLGVMGSSVAYHLARRGQKVLGLDRGAPTDSRGSSYGESRMIRSAYDHAGYIPLVARSYELWDELERQVHRPLRLRTGGLVVGPRDGQAFTSALASAQSNAIPHRIFSTAELRQHFPMLLFEDGEAGYLERDAAVMLAEECVRAHQEGAIRAGAELRFGVPMDLETLDLDRPPVDGGVLVIAVGSWAARIRDDLAVERVVSYWFDSDAAFVPERFPFVLWDRETAPMCILPALPRGVKVGLHHAGQPGDPDHPRAPTPLELETIQRRVRDVAPSLPAGPSSWHVSTYANTRDGHFVIDAVHPRKWILSACSGHGFKFAPVLGEMMADLICDGETRHRLVRG